MAEESDPLPLGRVPIPDPTTLTTEQLRRELANLRDLFDSRYQSAEHANASELVRLREFLESRIDAEARLTAERFTRMDTLFSEGDKRNQQLATANALALAAALQAAKEAVGEQNRSNGLAISKSEASFIEALKQQQTLFQTEMKGANDKIALIISRLDKGEGTVSGGREAHTDARLNLGQIMTALGLVFLGITVLIAAFGLHHP